MKRHSPCHGEGHDPIRSLLVALVALAPVGAEARAQSVTTLHAGGSPEDRVDVVLVAEGYRDEARFLEHAARVVGALRRKPPLDRYLGLLNVHAVFEASPGPGEGIARPGEPRATRFGTRFTSGSGRMITGDLAAIQQAALAAPDVDRVLVLCDDARHGGSAYGATAIFTTAFATAGDAFEDVAIHELGHLLGNLADEYANAAELGAAALTPDELAGLFAQNPNVSPFGERERLPWRAWVDGDTKVPAGLFTQGVSAFEGAAYRPEGMYRPRRRCAMRDNHGDFCEPCREALILGLARGARPTALDARVDGAALVVDVRSGLPSGELQVRHSREGDRWVVVVEDATSWVRGDRAPLTSRFELDAGGTVALRLGAPVASPGAAGLVASLPGGAP